MSIARFNKYNVAFVFCQLQLKDGLLLSVLCEILDVLGKEHIFRGLLILLKLL